MEHRRIRDIENYLLKDKFYEIKPNGINKYVGDGIRYNSLLRLGSQFGK